MTNPIPRIAVFVKSPRPGTVKTRLGQSIGMDRAAEVYRHLVADSLEAVAELGDRVEVFVYFTPLESEAECRDLLSLTPEFQTRTDAATTRIQFRAQSGGDLGDRMLAMFRELCEPAPRPTLVIGTDNPVIDGEIIEAALDALRDADVTFGPARDGGYYLLGMNEAHDVLFRDIPWSTGDVLERSLEACKVAGLRSSLVAELSDIDTVADLVTLRRELAETGASAAIALHTRRALSAISNQLDDAERR